MIKPRAYVGVDPGASGAICLLCPETKDTIFVDTTDKPSDLAATYNSWAETYELVVVCVEDVHALPGTSAGSSFQFGANTAIMTTIPEVLNLPMTRVKPKTWHKSIGLSIPAKLKGAPRRKFIKTEVARIVQALYPNAILHGPKGGLQDGKSDALAIAHHTFKEFRL